jgi:hypothetical protein
MQVPPSGLHVHVAWSHVANEHVDPAMQLMMHVAIEQSMLQLLPPLQTTVQVDWLQLVLQVLAPSHV